MEKIYYTSPYEREFEAKILDCRQEGEKYAVLLDRTAFYPEGGGQPSDTGYLGETRVTYVKEAGEMVVHYTDRPLVPGMTVKGVIDWDKRFSNMQQHSGEHIVSGLIARRYGYDNVGFHMGKEGMTIDINGVLTWEQLMEIEREANRIVWRNVPVSVLLPTEEERKNMAYRSKKALEGQIRIIVIPDADSCACCGTHVAFTGEIGVIKFLSVMHYKGGVRISLLCGRDALYDYERKTDQLLDISSQLSASTFATADAVRRLKGENGEKDARIGELWRRIFELRAEQLPAGNGKIAVFEPDLAPVQVRQLCECLLERGRGKIILVCSGDDSGGYSYCMGSRSTDVRDAGKVLNTALQGRGGGSSQMVQGTFRAAQRDIEETFRKICAEFEEEKKWS